LQVLSSSGPLKHVFSVRFPSCDLVSFVVISPQIPSEIAPRINLKL
jgi:hypothetical protein